MLTFFTKSSNAFTQKVEEKLQEMVVAHKVVRVNGDKKYSIPDSVKKDDLPVLFDGQKMYSSLEKIEQFLNELQAELNEGRSMQSDSCHIDPENPADCL